MKILKFHKIFGYKEIISSCDFGIFKENGNLFKVLKKKTKEKKRLKQKNIGKFKKNSNAKI